MKPFMRMSEADWGSISVLWIAILYQWKAKLRIDERYKARSKIEDRNKWKKQIEEFK